MCGTEGHNFVVFANSPSGSKDMFRSDGVATAICTKCGNLAEISYGNGISKCVVVSASFRTAA